jgi:hypothetical protein
MVGWVLAANMSNWLRPPWRPTRAVVLHLYARGKASIRSGVQAVLGWTAPEDPTLQPPTGWPG